MCLHPEDLLFTSESVMKHSVFRYECSENLITFSAIIKFAGGFLPFRDDSGYGLNVYVLPKFRC